MTSFSAIAEELNVKDNSSTKRNTINTGISFKEAFVLFQSLLIFIEKCVIIVLSERSNTMEFIIRAIYQEVEGEQMAWNVESKN